jgi:hypothetical protein
MGKARLDPIIVRFKNSSNATKEQVKRDYLLLQQLAGAAPGRTGPVLRRAAGPVPGLLVQMMDHPSAE